MHTEPNQVLLAKGWEKVQPVVGVSELGNICLCDLQLHQDFVLGQSRPFGVLRGLLALLLCRLVRACGSTSNLTLQANGCGRDGHASAVECEWEKSALTQLSLVSRHKLGLGQRVCVT